jgi:hypothetical protein
MTTEERVRDLWKRMCEHDGIDASDSTFAVSDGNPHKPAYDEALKRLQRERVPA